MKKLSWIAKVYILGILLLGLGLIGWMVVELDWSNMGMYLLSALGSVAQTLKVEGPNEKTNYNIAWFVYGFAFLALGPVAALFVVVVAHLVEWVWHRYPWYIQGFNLGAHGLPLFLAGLVFGTLSRGGLRLLDVSLALGIVAGNLVFVLGNHVLVGLVVKLARGQSFAESGVLGLFALLLDFTLLSMGTVTALLWQTSPVASVLNILPLYLLYNAIRVPALKRQLQQMQHGSPQHGFGISGD
jgi:hypothetical protein